LSYMNCAGKGTKVRVRPRGTGKALPEETARNSHRTAWRAPGGRTPCHPPCCRGAQSIKKQSSKADHRILVSRAYYRRFQRGFDRVKLHRSTLLPSPGEIPCGEPPSGDAGVCRPPVAQGTVKHASRVTSHMTKCVKVLRAKAKAKSMDQSQAWIWVGAV
jgi:hypothetical protein